MRPAIIDAACFPHRLEPFVDGLPEIVSFLASRDGSICERKNGRQPFAFVDLLFQLRSQVNIDQLWSLALFSLARMKRVDPEKFRFRAVLWVELDGVAHAQARL